MPPIVELAVLSFDDPLCHLFDTFHLRDVSINSQHLIMLPDGTYVEGYLLDNIVLLHHPASAAHERHDGKDDRGNDGEDDGEDDGDDAQFGRVCSMIGHYTRTELNWSIDRRENSGDDLRW